MINIAVLPVAVAPLSQLVWATLILGPKDNGLRYLRDRKNDAQLFDLRRWMKNETDCNSMQPLYRKDILKYRSLSKSHL